MNTMPNVRTFKLYSKKTTSHSRSYKTSSNEPALPGFTDLLSPRFLQNHHCTKQTSHTDHNTNPDSLSACSSHLPCRILLRTRTCTCARSRFTSRRRHRSITLRQSPNNTRDTSSRRRASRPIPKIATSRIYISVWLALHPQTVLLMAEKHSPWQKFNITSASTGSVGSNCPVTK
jgi:hypothetical protein